MLQPAAADVLASFTTRPPPAVLLHTIGITAIARFSSAFHIPQLADAVDRAACPHLALLSPSFARAFHAPHLPGLSNNNPSLAAAAVVAARKCSHVTDAKFVITHPDFPKVFHLPPPPSISVPLTPRPCAGQRRDICLR
jgi:hypothetical protein